MRGLEGSELWGFAREIVFVISTRCDPRYRTYAPSRVEHCLHQAQ